MSVLGSIFVHDRGRGVPHAITRTVAAGATGVVATLTRLLATASFTRVSGTPVISATGEISLAAGLADGASLTMVVREATGAIACEYPVTLTGWVDVNAPPFNLTVPVISGTVREGETLTASAVTWSRPPDGVAWQWCRGGTPIAGSIATTHILAAADVGAAMTVIATATFSGGATVSATSAATVAVVATVPPAPAISTAPVLSGTGQVGQTLSVTNGSWTNSPTGYAWQWLRDGIDIAGATAQTYLQVAADGGTTLTCRVSASNAGGIGTALSNAITVVDPVSTFAMQPTITGPGGAKRADTPLTFAMGDVAGAKVDRFEYEVRSTDATPVVFIARKPAGALESGTLGVSAIGKTLVLQVWAFTAGGTTPVATATSLPFGPIEQSASTLVAAVAFSTTASQQGSLPSNIYSWLGTPMPKEVRNNTNQGMTALKYGYEGTGTTGHDVATVVVQGGVRQLSGRWRTNLRNTVASFFIEIPELDVDYAVYAGFASGGRLVVYDGVVTNPVYETNAGGTASTNNPNSTVANAKQDILANIYIGETVGGVAYTAAEMWAKMPRTSGYAGYGGEPLIIRPTHAQKRIMFANPLNVTGHLGFIAVVKV